MNKYSIGHFHLKSNYIKILIKFLIMVIALQTLQVYSLVLNAEQAGHFAGLLSHKHDTNNNTLTKNTGGSLFEEGTNLENNFSELSKEQHESQCHPAHVLLKPVQYILTLYHSKPVLKVFLSTNFQSIVPVLDPPPPKPETA